MTRHRHALALNLLDPAPWRCVRRRGAGPGLAGLGLIAPTSSAAGTVPAVTRWVSPSGDGGLLVTR